MTAIWRKVVRDVWRERTRAALVALAIAIGLTGFQSVLSTYAVLRREITRDYLNTNPASAVITTESVDDALLRAVIDRDDVEDADARRMWMGRIDTASGQWRRLIVFVVRDFRELRISTISPEGGEWPPAPGSLLVERDAFQVIDRRIGDVVKIQMPAGGARTVRIAGRVHDAGQAQARMENVVYAYMTPVTSASLGQSATFDRLLLQASGDRFDRQRVEQVAGAVKAWLEAGGHPVTRTDVPPPGEHPHAGIMDLLLLVMAAFGLFTVALSGVIAANLLLAMVAAERRQIAVMKAVGGSRGQIASVYLAEAALFGVAAVAVGLPAGVAGGRFLSQWFADLLNFDLTSLAAPTWVYLLAVSVGVMVPVVAGAYPVAAATAVTVRETLAALECDPGRFGIGPIERLICGVGGGPGRPLLLGIRNALRRRTRTALTVMTLTTAGTFFITGLTLRHSMIAGLDRQFGVGTTGSDARYAIDQHMLMFYVFLIVVSVIIAAVGGLGLMTATSLNVLERRRELGVLRAIGAPPGMVASIVVIEALAVTLAAWGLAVLLAWPIAEGIGSRIVLPFFRKGVDALFTPVAIFGWLGISIGLAIVASLVPALRASRRSVREALSHE